MAATVKNSMQFLQEMLTKQHDLSADNLKIALMDTSFSFNPVTHATWSDCSANEIAGGYGYTAGGQIITNPAVSIQTSPDNHVLVSADSPIWTANGGDIPTIGSAIIYNDSHANKTVVQHIQFTANYSTPDGKIFQIDFSNGMREFYNYI